jgi:hypothetical protein
VTGDEDDRDRNIFPCKLLLEIEPAQTRKPDVDDDAARTLWAFASQEFRGGSKQRGLQVDGFEQAYQRIANVRIVIDDDDEGLGLAHSTLSSVGSVNCTKAP